MGQMRRPFSRSPFPSADEIAERAHDLFVTGGRRVARIPEYWRIAETELLERAAYRVLNQQPSASGGENAQVMRPNSQRPKR
jgi:hypothetical protein